MTRNDCDNVRELLQDPSGRERDSRLARHVESCPECAEELKVARWMRQGAAETQHVPESLPSASQLWWKAQIIRRLTEREELAERAARPLRWTQWAGLALGCVLATLLVAWWVSGLASGLTATALGDEVSAWRTLVGLFAVGTLLPLAGFGLFWMMWREA